MKGKNDMGIFFRRFLFLYGDLWLLLPHMCSMSDFSTQKDDLCPKKEFYMWTQVVSEIRPFSYNDNVNKII